MPAKRGITQAQAAARMGITQGRLSAIEHAKPSTTELRTLAAYVEALGGRLEIIADFGDQRLAFTEPQPDGNSAFCQVGASYSIGLRSRERRLESCRWHW